MFYITLRLTFNRLWAQRFITLIIITFVLSTNTSIASNFDTSYTKELNAYEWSPISDVEKTMQYENQKDLTKRSIDQAKLAAEHYITGVSLMKKKEYTDNHYHALSDEVLDSWVYDGMIEDNKILFRVGYAVSQNDEWPTWNEGTEFKEKRAISLDSN